MNVKELIEKLKEFDGEMMVVSDNGYVWDEVEIAEVVICDEDSTYIDEDQYDDETSIRAIRIA